MIKHFDVPDDIQIMIRELIYKNQDDFKTIKDNKSTIQRFKSATIPELSTKEDVVRSIAARNVNLYRFDQYDVRIKEIQKLLSADKCTNAIMYPKNTIMDWHTNADIVGERAYIIYTKEPGIFRYRDPKTKEIIDDIDNVGFTGRIFPIGKTKEDLLWHTVWSPGKRFSFGFNFERDHIHKPVE